MSTAAYNPPRLTERLEALLAATFGPDHVPSVHELGPFDQFHTGGLAATMQLGELLSPARNDAVLDVGAGLGGPARALAATYGCRVTGIDLSDAFVEAAGVLTARAGLGERVEVVAGDASALPFPAATFDAAIMLHVAMNVEDRASLYAGIRRVLRDGGRFLTYDVIARGGEPSYPVPWARDRSASFLTSEAETRSLLTAAGFAVDEWRVADPHIASTLVPPPGAPPPAIAALLGPDFPERTRNLAAAIADGRVAVLTALLSAA